MSYADFRLSPRSRRADEEPRLMRFHTFGLVAVGLGASAATGLGIGAIGAGVASNLIGQNQQKKANEGAQAANQRAQTQQNDAAWANYLMSRGIAPTGPVAAGVLPSAGQYKAVNTKLPIWATMRSATPVAQSKRKILGVPASSAPVASAPVASAPTPFVKPLPPPPRERVME